MECTWDAALLKRGDLLPPELLQIIQHGSNEQYLQALTKAALDPRYTYTLLAHGDNIFAHICASLRSHASFAASVATLGRIIPFAPHLTSYATQLLESEQHQLGSSDNANEDQIYLLGLFRLLRFDHRLFRRHASTHELAASLGRSSRPVTYLIIRILQICLEGADNWFEETVRRYLGDDTPDGDIDGLWDEKTVDYRFLSLWEDDRFETVTKTINDFQMMESTLPSQACHTLEPDAFHPSVALVGNVLFPIISTASSDSRYLTPTLIQTRTVSLNLESFAAGLKSRQPLLLSGLAGSGKSMLVRHAARSVGKLDKLVTLHLNEQSDAKLLLGLYTTGETPGSFLWKPGVLTTAVQEGRWVLIEDIDRAPNDVLGTLLPLIEKRQLLIPNRKETVHAAEGFRLLATVRSSVNHRGEETKPLTHMLGIRHWQSIAVDMPSIPEHATIAHGLFPGLEQLLPQFIAVYERLSAAKSHAAVLGQAKTGVVRPVSPRDLFKWCQRVSTLLKGRTTLNSSEIDTIYLEAVDCFVGAIPDGLAREHLTAIVAEELRIDPQRRDYLLTSRDVQYVTDKAKIQIGNYIIPRVRHSKIVEGSFSTNPHTACMLERVTAAVLNQEPLLLVGETGVGKTTAVQHLATQLGKKLVPFNLSQQSEAGDLLGGFKPVNARTLMVPMKDEFDDLFAESFSSSKNKQFLELLGKQMAKSNWKSVCKLWRQALLMVDQQRSLSPPREGEAPSKKRKVDTAKAIDFNKWDAFAFRVDTIEKKLASGNDVFAFTFVEGNIVKAVRSGDWVLLDEINLASSDTLESIADLLDSSSPSLLLTEAGNIERVTAHPEFRVFAAMNPATDVGKKDLPPGIRSRFTELYVESPDKDLKSLQSIVRAYLRQECTSDAAVALDVSVLYQKIVALAAENRLVDGAGQKPHFSLRTLTRTLSYAKVIQQMCSIRRALYEGFQMSFLTFLDAESVKLVQPSIEQHLFGKRINVKAELQKALRKPTDGRSYVQGYPGSKHWIRQGAEELQDEAHYILTPFVRSNLENLVRATSTRQFPVLIQGPTSSGKTSMIEYLAKRTGHKFTRINNHEHTDLQEYLGTYVSGTDGRLQFQEGVLVKALREGHWIVLDELNLAPTDVLEALNRLLDDNRELLVPETQETIRPHPDFMLFATQNPAGLYGGRKTLSRAFRNRFLELHFDDIPVNELQDILHRRTQLPESRCRRIVNVYKELSVLRQENRLFEQKSFATLRDLFRWALRPNDTIEQLAANGYMLLCERVRKLDERIALKAVIEKAMSEKGPRVTIDENLLYADDSSEISQYQRDSIQHGVVWTKAMRRLYVLVSRAIQNNEPVLLVGETGCGKTTVCQMLAEALKKDLHTVNAHQNTETGDLIGSQRPVRNRAAIEASLRQRLLASPIAPTVEPSQDTPTDDLLAAYDNAIKSAEEEQKKDYLQSPAHAEIQALRIRFKALFEWADGSLVHAMRNGDFFLLDEISLADDSVLERINSVLESQRTILLAEKGSLDSFLTAAPGFQFFATMNPGGDYGKRELSPALRNRFTEIWVPALSDMEDILQIVRAKLVEPVQPYAEIIVAFATWFKARFNTSASSSVSIRDTLAWIDFINAFAHIRLDAAVVHGAAMVYIDTLGANPAGLMTLTSMSIEEERSSCLDKLGQMLECDVRGINDGAFEASSTEREFSIGPFSISRVLDATAGDIGFSFEPRTTRVNAMRVLRALQLSKPVMLEGSPGVGKTALVTAIANAAGMPLTRINLSDQTDLLDLFGSDAPVEGAQTGTFVWRDAPFLRAMKTGEWVLLDEMNLASQSVLEGLNACLDHRGEVFVPELGQSFTRHPSFRLFAAQNPHHQGGGRKGLPASFVNRFTVVYADSFKSDDLKLICQHMFPSLAGQYLEQAISFVSKLHDEVANRRTFGSLGGPWEFNLRDLTRWLTLASSREGLLKAGTPYDFVSILFIQRFRTPQDQSYVKQLFVSVFQSDPITADLFCNASTHTLQVGLGLLSRDLLTSHPKGLQAQTSSAPQLKALQTVMLCVQKNWPVLLSGPPGTGKTTLIENLAASVGAEVVTIAMSAETDALDLIGGYEQYDPHRQTTQALRRLEALVEQHSKRHLLDGGVREAVALLGSLDSLTEQPHSPTELSKLAGAIRSKCEQDMLPLLEVLRQGQQAIDKARFEWIDGPLIEALQEGKWLVLDNANLCSPSVLDRLNSLLEPNGALIVNEHSTPDGAARIIRPHPSFRIFLTVDPRSGELSRAMRNRAVEVYLIRNDAEHMSLTDGLEAESALARFTATKAARAAMTMSGDAAVIFSDHLALNDSALVPRLQRQLEQGLYRDATGSSRDLFIASFEAGSSTLEALYIELSSCMQAPADFACVQVSGSAPSVSINQADGKLSLQTFHPLNNQPLAQQSQHFYSQALSLAAKHDLKISFGAIAKALSQAKLDRKLAERLGRLWKSVRQELQSSSRDCNGFLDAVEKILQVIQVWVDQLPTLPDTAHLPRVKATLQGVIAYAWTLIQGITSGSFDLGLLTGLTSVGQTLASASLSTLSPSALQFQEALSHISLKTTSSSGHAFTILWQSLRPLMPSTTNQLEAVLKLEAVMDRFDHATSNFQLPLAQIVVLRTSFQRALNAGYVDGSDLDALAERAVAAVPIIPENQDGAVSTSLPHFAESFELLCRHFATLMLGGIRFDQAKITTLETLALRRTSDSVGNTTDQLLKSPASHFRLLALTSRISTRPVTDLETTGAASVSGSLLQSLQTVDNVTLRSLSLLEAETKTLGSTLSTKAHLLEETDLRALDTCLRYLLLTVLESLANSREAQGLREQAIRLSQVLKRETDLGANIGQMDGSSHQAIWQRLSAVAAYLLQDKSGPLAEASAAWMSFSLACLALYIPDRAYDPVLEAQIHKAIYQRSKDDLTSRLNALRRFREAWVGEPDSLRARLLHEEINALGSGPSVIEICRPATSQLAQLHGDFQSIMRVVQPLRQSKTDVLDSSSWDNLLILRQRLHQHYRAYADLTTPIIGFIDCLAVSRRLASRAERQSVEAATSIATITPLLGASIQHWLDHEQFLAVQKDCRSKDEQLYWLSAVSLRSTVTPIIKLSSGLRAAIDSTFRNFYEIWRVELSRDQKLTAANSSLYRYQGSDDNEDEATQEALDELFPTYEGESGRQNTNSGIGSAQALAPKLAALYHAIHVPGEMAPELISDLLHQSTRFARNSTSIDCQMSLPALLNGLHGLAERLSPSTSAPRPANIYTDANIQQAKALVALIERVQSRFQAIHAAWPEHATPIEVLRCCDQILELGHSEPIVRFLPSVEKLHATINEWQKVASSELSASILLEETTSLIISWRQLELSTWAGMFNFEDEQCKTHAASWWYVAYETIIRASDDISGDSAELASFKRGLVETLGGFLANCGLGEYSLRLRLLRDFEAALDARVADNAQLSVVRDGLASMVSFYSRFESAVTEQLIKKRAELEKDIKNVIQLASWKDRNIETLKQSAKSSHKKLFRIVRKYRQLLAQPVAPLVQAEFPVVKYELGALHRTQLHAQVYASDMDASKLPSWLSRPANLQDIQLISRDIEQLASASTATLATKRIEKFMQELQEESEELRKATPSTATEKNKSLIQHLKTRKRRLLADVLRDVRLMGFQTNISDEVLAKQQSLHLVLANTPALPAATRISGTAAADQEFHRLLHTMSVARESAVKHSEDLTPAEVARSTLLLESMLQVSAEQRNVLREQITNVAAFQSVLDQFATLCTGEGTAVQQPSLESSQTIATKAATVSGVLQACIQAVEKQEKLSGISYQHVIDTLSGVVSELCQVQNAIREHSGLPHQLDIEPIRVVRTRYAAATASMQATITSAVSQHPELQPTLSQLFKWTDNNAQEDRPDNKTHITPDAWVQRLVDVLSQVQASSLDPQTAPVNGQSKRAWLLEQQNLLNASAQCVRLNDVAQNLGELLGSLHAVSFNQNATLPEIIAACRSVYPLLEAYSQAAQHLVTGICALHGATSKLAHRLATSFVQITRQGFCQPSDKTQDDDDQSGQVESGTGLGEGEGGEDISKDVGDNEDLSELAQEATTKDKDEDTQAEKDAVDMADEDLEGNFDEDAGSEGEEGDEAKEEQEDGDMDEEAGHVDEDDAGAVDEKTWNDGKTEEAEKEAESGKGTKSEDVSAAAENAKNEGEEQPQEQQEETEAGAEEESEVARNETEMADPHMENEENLDLPEDLNMDGDKAVESDFSDVDSDLEDEIGEADAHGPDDAEPDVKDVEMGEDDGGDDAEENGEAAEPEEEVEAADQEPMEQDSDINMLDKPDLDAQPDDGLKSAEDGHGQQDENAAQSNGALSGVEQMDDDNDAEQPSGQPVTAEGNNRTQQDSSSGQVEPGEDQKTLPYKQLGDLLNQWYEQHRNIEAAQETSNEEPTSNEATDMNDMRFEHTDDADTEMQALGAARAEQSTALNEQNAVPLEQSEPDTAQQLEDPQDVPQDQPTEDAEGGAATAGTADQAAQSSKAMVGPAADFEMSMDEEMQDAESDDVEDVDEQLTNTHLSHDRPEPLSIAEARQTWTDHEGRTRNMAVVLTEHLRLILQPTQATKMRGDFRTGKRLNIKKIIPYIASSYKRDKIWMRRSVPSKRTYQIMLAIDDSESMNESDRKALAFDTLALVAKSLSMLEVGELCIVGFGETVNVAHDFSMLFTSDAGAEVVRQFSFSQSKTDVRKLLQGSIELFRTARLKASGSASNLWQLQLIISDGLCEDHPSIRQLVRQAHEEQIMVVFIVVDATAPGSAAVGPKQSILDLQRVEFMTDPQGEPQINMIKYLDTFPFRYYLIVRDVLELPSVLAGALRQWFAEVVETGG